jgi:hypothetical protein
MVTGRSGETVDDDAMVTAGSCDGERSLGQRAVLSRKPAIDVGRGKRGEGAEARSDDDRRSPIGVSGGRALTGWLLGDG